jgi:hypothetical protein
MPQIEQQPFSQEIMNAVQNGVLIVSGSRSIQQTPHVAWAVDLAKERGWAVAVGDATGVDTLVMKQCELQGVPYIVLGCEAVGHCRNCSPGAISWLIPGGDVRGSCYLIRDRALAELASRAPKAGFVGIWDGKSRGTRYTMEACTSVGIGCLLLGPNGQRCVTPAQD